MAEKGRDGCFLSHIRSAFLLLQSTSSEYVLVLEDDVVFNDIDRLNSKINEAIDTMNGFNVFTVSTYEHANTLHKPPRPNTWLMHFVLYRREAIPMIIQRLVWSWLINTACDGWRPEYMDVVVYDSTDCAQLTNYFISDDINTAGYVPHVILLKLMDVENNMNLPTRLRKVIDLRFKEFDYRYKNIIIRGYKPINDKVLLMNYDGSTRTIPINSDGRTVEEHIIKTERLTTPGATYIIIDEATGEIRRIELK